MHACSWDQESEIEKAFFLKKIKADARCFRFEQDWADAVFFFDAFGPDVQPLLWSADIFCKMFELLKKSGGVLTLIRPRASLNGI